MARHRDALVSFDVPRDWIDRTVVAYAAPDNGTANIVMTRDTLAEEENLESYADRQLSALANHLRGFVLEANETGEIAGRPATLVRFRSSGPDEPLVQRLVVVALPDRRVIAFTLTAPARDAPQLGPLFDRIVGSIAVEES